MSDPETLALLGHIRDIGERTERKLDNHIERDEKISNEFVLPVWNDYQQRKGKKETTDTNGKIAGYCINAGIAIVAAFAAVKGLGK